MTHLPLVKLTAMTLALTCFAGTAAAQEAVKIATVDLLKVFDSYWKTKLSNDQLKERGTDFDKARVGMIDDINLLREEYNRLNASSKDPANPEEKRADDREKAQGKNLEINRLEQQIIDFNQNAQKTLADRTRGLRKDRLEEIQEVINAKARELGYDLVVDSSQDVVLPRTPTVLYTNSKNDITKIALAELNKDAPEIPDPISTPIPEQESKPTPDPETTVNESPIPPPGTRTPPPDNYPEPTTSPGPFVVPASVENVFKIIFGHATTMVGYDMTTEGKPMILLSEPGDGQVHNFESNPTTLPLLNDGKWLYVDYPGIAIGCIYVALVIREPNTGNMKLPEKWLQENFPDFSQYAVPYWKGFCAPAAFGNVAWALRGKHPNLNPARIFDLDVDATPSLKANMLVGGIKAIPHPDSLAGLMNTKKEGGTNTRGMINGVGEYFRKNDSAEWKIHEPQYLRPTQLLENLRRESSRGAGIVLGMLWGNPAMEDEEKGGALMVVCERNPAQEVDETEPVEDEPKPPGIFYVFGAIILAATTVGLFVILARGRRS